MTVERMLKRKEVESLVGYSKASIYRLIGLGSFPEPVKYNERTSRWRESDIAKWQQEQFAKAAPS